MTTSTIEELPLFDPFSPEYQLDWHGQNRVAREAGPMARTPLGLEVLSYELVQAALRDRRFLVPAGLTLAAQGITSGPLWDWATSGILSIDGDEHARLRRLVAQAFTPREAERLRSSMRHIFCSTLDQLSPATECDVVQLVRSYPIAVICELLGTPAEDWPRISDWADDVFRIFQWNAAEDGPTILRAVDELYAYIDAMVEARRDAPRDDLITQLMRAEDEGDRLAHDELQMLASAVLTAGTDTTRNQLAAAVEVLAAHPDQWELLAEHPELAPRAVDEVMRHAPIILGTARQPVDELELNGIAIPAGTLIQLNTSAANRDPAVYPEPDRLDIRREGQASPLTFGGGIHYCLGVHLAKAELAEALVQLTARWTDVRVTGPVPWKPVIGISGPASLPISFRWR